MQLVPLHSGAELPQLIDVAGAQTAGTMPTTASLCTAAMHLQMTGRTYKRLIKMQTLLL